MDAVVLLGTYERASKCRAGLAAQSLEMTAELLPCRNVAAEVRSDGPHDTVGVSECLRHALR